MEKAPLHDCVPVLSTDPLYILYTSGTTGDPKVMERQVNGVQLTVAWSGLKLNLWYFPDILTYVMLVKQIFASAKHNEL